MRRGTRVGEHVGPSTRWAVIQELRLAGVEILTGIAYEAIEPSAVLIRDADGVQRRIAADTVVIAAGQESERALAHALERAGKPHLVIGGAASATELDAERAFREGAGTPRAIAALLARPVPRTPA
jgi:2,4-dienoyl-CoA reductase (NADPH2)